MNCIFGKSKILSRPIKSFMNSIKFKIPPFLTPKVPCPWLPENKLPFWPVTSAFNYGTFHVTQIIYKLSSKKLTLAHKKLFGLALSAQMVTPSSVHSKTRSKSIKSFLPNLSLSFSSTSRDVLSYYIVTEDIMSPASMEKGLIVALKLSINLHLLKFVQLRFMQRLQQCYGTKWTTN
jgi:hypothetical protein